MDLMTRTLFAGLTAVLVLAATPSVQAQTATARHPVAEAAMQQLVERRIDVLKVTLGLTPDQQKLWPAVESAIRAQAARRHERVAKLAARLASDSTGNVIDLMRNRADALAQKATTLKG